MTNFSPAVLEQVALRLAVCGAPGSELAHTALAMASALGDRMAVIDTDRGSTARYAGADGEGFAFDAMRLDTFKPDYLVRALATAVMGRYPVVVLHSLSDWWMGSGGLLEQADAAIRAAGGSTQAGWAEVRPAERRMLDAIATYPGHVVATMRSRFEYTMAVDDQGGTQVRRVALRPEQRDGIEWQFDAVGDLGEGRNGALTVTASRCPVLHAGTVFEEPAELAGQLLAWSSAGAPVPNAFLYLDRLRTLTSSQEAQELSAELAGRRLLTLPVLRDNGTVASIGVLVDERRKALYANERNEARRAARERAAAERAARAAGGES